jgi:hypothetical protein
MSLLNSIPALGGGTDPSASIKQATTEAEGADLVSTRS